MMKFDEKKLAQLKTGSQHFDEKYGSVGSPSRVEFEAKAKAWYYAELLRDERKCSSARSCLSPMRWECDSL